MVSRVACRVASCCRHSPPSSLLHALLGCPTDVELHGKVMQPGQPSLHRLAGAVHEQHKDAGYAWWLIMSQHLP